jgi:hypothetical protein
MVNVTGTQRLSDTPDAFARLGESTVLKISLFGATGSVSAQPAAVIAVIRLKTRAIGGRMPSLW